MSEDRTSHFGGSEVIYLYSTEVGQVNLKESEY